MDEKTSQKTSNLKWLVLLAGLILLLVAAIFLSQRAAMAAPSQPIAFSHQLHTERGVQCLYCHPNAMRSDVAGIPSVGMCVGCHQFIATERPEVQTILGYWERNEPIPWQSVVRMADHVFFSHQPHLSASVSCETCHGEVSRMTVARPAINMDMGWCLDCHLKQPEEKVARLADCMACHK
ncbi:MAG: menaquinol oxidoreductase [Anaerolineales bacterium]|nr:menaquinol oxidoreductase [Anaerolineales bacterium]